MCRRPTTATLVLTLLVNASNAFMPLSRTFVTPKKTSSSSLYISLTDGIQFERAPTEKVVDPNKNIQAYLNRPENGTTVRDNLKGNCIVTGLLRTDDDSYRDDQTMFDLLNAEDSKFDFEKLICYSTDSAYAKKRMVSRKARYTGLLDVLDFEQGIDPIIPPSDGILSTCTSWVAYIEDNHLDYVRQIAQLYRDTPSLENVAILLVNASPQLNNETLMEMETTLTNTGKAGYSIVAVGSLTDAPESNCTYSFIPFGSENRFKEMTTFSNKTISFDTTHMYELSRALSYRLISDMLQLKAGESKSLTFLQLADPEYARRKVVETTLLDGLREGGFTRSEELEHLLNGGINDFAQAIVNYRQTPYFKYKGTNYGNNWWEHPYYMNSARMRAEKEAPQRELEARWKKNNDTIIEIAKEYGQREYYKKVVALSQKEGGGSSNSRLQYGTETEFIENNWDECLEAGIKRFVELYGFDGTRDMEEERFQAMMKKKERAAELQAKANVNKMLAELEAEFPDAYKDFDDDEDEYEEDDKNEDEGIFGLPESSEDTFFETKAYEDEDDDSDEYSIM